MLSEVTKPIFQGEGGLLCTLACYETRHYFAKKVRLEICNIMVRLYIYVIAII